MGDATALAEQIRRERLICGKQPKSGGEIDVLEQQLAQTWMAIRLARAPGGVIYGDPRRHSKWE
jgi:hypothetical protein